MQSLPWYASRLRAMSWQEVCWRLACKAREATDRCLLKVRQRPINLVVPELKAALGVS